MDVGLVPICQNLQVERSGKYEISVEFTLMLLHSEVSTYVALFLLFKIVFASSPPVKSLRMISSMVNSNQITFHIARHFVYFTYYDKTNRQISAYDQEKNREIKCLIMYYDQEKNREIKCFIMHYDQERNREIKCLICLNVQITPEQIFKKKSGSFIQWTKFISTIFILSDIIVCLQI